MPKAIKSPQSKADLGQIWVSIAVDNIAAADRLIDVIDRLIARLSKYPQLGRERNELHKGLRSYPVKNYLVFYVPVEDGIEVVRVLHGARNLKREFRKRR